MKLNREQLPVRILAGLAGGIVVLQTVAGLSSGKLEYLNFFGQWISTPVGLLVGVIGLAVAILPWPRSKGRKGRSKSRFIPRHTSDDLPGRNDPCHCGSGKKYKRCCLREDERASRRARASGRRSRLNRSQAVTSGTEMANRGLKS